MFASLPAAHAQEVRATAPVRDFSLPVFTAEGHRSLLLRAGTADVRNRTQVKLTDVTVTTFTEDATNRVETVLVTPQATANVDGNKVTSVEGAAAIRLVRDEFELTGTGWRYVPGEAGKWVFTSRDVRVVFNASLPDLLP